ncbi:MAG: cyclic pyranopterin monophosphate synthase MoaC, partial [Actinomycetota bacterium]|jgi:cyclic pyranopterin phosphate synthase|nr:cyclic pyranopterin monophosphate synthase MoaC [Actinomycetota bacterium]
MEAMTGAAIGAIAFYDMIKGLDRGAEIGPVRLIAKSGGKSGDWRRG